MIAEVRYRDEKSSLPRRELVADEISRSRSIEDDGTKLRQYNGLRAQPALARVVI